MPENPGYILGIDVGTSSLKAVTYNLAGKVLAVTSESYTYATPRAGWAEMNPETWWTALQKALAALGRQIDLNNIAALALTGQMHSAILLDRHYNIIQPTILWLDRRAAAETQELKLCLNLPPYQLNSTYTLPKLLWLYKHHPEVIAKVHKILWPKDYLRWRLTGEICTDPTETLGTGLYDWSGNKWALDRLSLVGLAPGVLPEIRPSGAAAGVLLPEIAAELGLSRQTHVLTGMGDIAALLGGAPLKPGRVVCSLGSSSMIFAALQEGQNPQAPGDALYTVNLPPYRLFGGVSSTTGAALMWLYENILGGRTQQLEFPELVRGALEIAPGCQGLCFIPYLAGERSPYWNDGIKAGFYGLTLTHDSRHLTRAVMEGVAYSLRHLLDIYTSCGVEVEELAMAAGGVRVQGWVEMIADICRKDVLIYAGQETVTRVLYALCAAYLGQDSFEGALLHTFGEPELAAGSGQDGQAYDEAYLLYRSYAAFACTIQN